MNTIKPLAFYLPQFHPIPENDQWWQKGFTEWTNVGKAKPLFKGHNQPLLPKDLGYYDLRVPEVRRQQAQMAKEYGVHGFVYYHYWFGNGKQVLERVAAEVLSSQEPDFPFCFCWANETWSGIWHGLNNRILVEQTYPGTKDIQQHFDYLLPFFKDERYIKVDNKPVFIIYNSTHLHENSDGYLHNLQELAIQAGFKGLYLISSHLNKEDATKFSKLGYDGKISYAFHKAWYNSKNVNHTFLNRQIKKYRKYITKKEHHILRIQDSNEIVDSMCFEPTDVHTYPQILPNWDNTPRSGKRGSIIINSTAENFEKQIKKSLDFISSQTLPENFLFIKSWNEWAEGNILEPDMTNGYLFLESLKKSIINKR
ncbi:Glycosyltransferase WbsX [Sphingobacterium nematocida]|uniref:Glycosyltransferase WbsX n=1 Tax=Sphingobacterium nematocida TaxID=1513896 RepID=A0A1T5BDB4_9SPHI|nr:glycoside hydrolase family 99-like domain-containing protein [Sphingobacterium nematocida]SKB45218.1 Glycosyltransferase WbsX [Sphingobacterium nematocida]